MIESYNLLTYRLSSRRGGRERKKKQNTLLQYDCQIWSDLGEFVVLLPEDKCKETKAILQEGEREPSEIIDTAMDIASTGFRQVAGGAVVRRQDWLKATSFRPELVKNIRCAI